MTNHYKTLQSAFEQALKLEGLEQDAFIESFGVDHPALLEQLRGLLVADAKTDHALAGPIAESADAIASTDGDPWLHRSVGAWKIVDRIADGGMGAVFLAERVDQQYEQQVAIKIMSARLLASDAIERFKAERQILANLSHPYIAQLHDGGATEDDLPYLVMEYIDGLPIDEHCIKHALDIDERLALFVKVCTAVDHAHRNLTVHRDLKPSNILIDQRGDPKLLDFGIAKLLDTQTGEPTDELTRAGGRAMTPQYASPEQVRGEPISVATDVYSLGVLLYRLMTGTSPYGDMTASSVSIEQAILDITPSRPSTLFETTGQPNSDQHLAGNSDRQIRNKLSGDLDTIILKALQKEADRRYPSVAMFAADVGRYLTHQPIEARGDNWLYRTRKFATRHARGLALTGVLLAGSLSMITYYTVQVTAARDAAELEAEKSSQVVEFLTEVFRSSSPYYSEGVDVSVREVLSEGARNIETALADQPELLSELLLRIGNIHQDLSLYEEAAELFNKGLVVSENFYGEDHPVVAANLVVLGGVHLEADDPNAALSVTERALGILEKNRQLDGAAAANAYHVRGNAYLSLNDTAKMKLALEKALAIYRLLGTAYRGNSAEVLSDLSSAYRGVKDYEKAISLTAQAYDEKVAVYGRQHPTIAVNLIQQATIHFEKGDIEKAEKLYRQSLELLDTLFGRDHPDYATGLLRIANVISMSERWSEAEPLLEEANAIFQQKFGAEHIRTEDTQRLLAEVYTETGRMDDALRIMEITKERADRHRNERPIYSGIGYAEYADTLLEFGKAAAAAKAYEKSVEIFKDANADMYAAYTEGKWGRALLAIDQIDEAAIVINDANAFCEANLSDQHPVVGRTLVARGELAIKQGNADLARESAIAAIENIEANNAADGVWYQMAKTIIAEADLLDGDTETAKLGLQSVINNLRRDNGTRSRAETQAQRILDRIKQ